MRRFVVVSMLAAIISASTLAVLSSQRIASSGPPRASTDIAAGKSPLRGGPQGVVKTATGYPVEGLMVQLISQKTSIRTTVYTDPIGHYEFPVLETGDYVLRLARPLEFRPYRNDSV